MAFFGSTLQIFQILGCLFHIWALVLNFTQVYLKRQGPIGHGGPTGTPLQGAVARAQRVRSELAAS
jgi:hypothetical protein